VSKDAVAVGVLEDEDAIFRLLRQLARIGVALGHPEPFRDGDGHRNSLANVGFAVANRRTLKPGGGVITSAASSTDVGIREQIVGAADGVWRFGFRLVERKSSKFTWHHVRVFIRRADEIPCPFGFRDRRRRGSCLPSCQGRMEEPGRVLADQFDARWSRAVRRDEECRPAMRYLEGCGGERALRLVAATAVRADPVLPLMAAYHVAAAVGRFGDRIALDGLVP